MKRFAVRVGRFFWSWRFLKIVLWTATIIVLFYAEEDWRGARDWAATKTKWEARGETFDFNRLVPPPVLDAQNLAALPLFKQEHDSKSNGMLRPFALEHALRNDLPGNDLPNGLIGNAATGELPDLVKIRTSIAFAYAEGFKNSPAIIDPLAQFEALYPFIAELRTTAAMRSSCRFDQDYLFENSPYPFSMLLITDQIRASRIISIHAILALDEHRPDVALGDIHVNLQIADGLRRQPMLVSGLVAIAVTTMTLPVIHDGLATHAWSGDQIDHLESELSQIDYFANYQLALRGEALNMLSLLENMRAWRPAKTDAASAKSNRHSYFPDVDSLFFDWWPAGWTDQLKVRGTDFDLTAAHFLDRRLRTVQVSRVDVFENELGHRGNIHSLWDILADVAVGPVAAATQNFTQAQANVDMARIGCALERYRMNYSAYPGTLNELTPAFIDALPHDVIDGAPYRYRPQARGGYLLYSVGWNQKDDGGFLVFKTISNSHHPQIDPDRGDWVWSVLKTEQPR
jgi:hypothetical protein